MIIRRIADGFSNEVTESVHLFFGGKDLDRWAPPFGDRGARPAPAVAVAWTRPQVLVHRSWIETSTQAWLPTDDVLRVRAHPNPVPVVAGVKFRSAELTEVPGLALAHAHHAGAASASSARQSPLRTRTRTDRRPTQRFAGGDARRRGSW